MTAIDKIKEGEKRVEEKTEELIYEFHAHYQEYIKLCRKWGTVIGK